MNFGTFVYLMVCIPENIVFHILHGYTETGRGICGAGLCHAGSEIDMCIVAPHTLFPVLLTGFQFLS